MKRILTSLLCGLLLAAAVGCAWNGKSQDSPNDYQLYFLEQDLKEAYGESALRAEAVTLPEDMESAQTRDTAELLVQKLLEGPQTPELKSPIPAGTTLLSLEMNGRQALVDLSAPYGTLSGVSLTLADCALTMTLTQLPEVLSVKITVRGRELDYRDKQSFMEHDILLAPEGDVLGEITVMLYFLNADSVLRGEERTLELYEGDTQTSAVTRALSEGPKNSELRPVLPEGFRVRSVWLEEDVCYVNLSSALVETVPDGAELFYALRALSRSLCSLDTVSEVRFLVDGEFAERYGSVNIAEPYMG